MCSCVCCCVQEIAAKKRERARENQNRGDGRGGDPLCSHIPPQGLLNRLLNNILIVAGFALFAYTVAYLLNNLD